MQETDICVLKVKTFSKFAIFEKNKMSKFDLNSTSSGQNLELVTHKFSKTTTNWFLKFKIHKLTNKGSKEKQKYI